MSGQGDDKSDLKRALLDCLIEDATEDSDFNFLILKEMLKKRLIELSVESGMSEMEVLYCLWQFRKERSEREMEEAKE